MVPRLSILCFIRLTRVSSQMCFLVTTSTFSLREWIKQARSCSSWVTTKVPGSSRRKCSIKKTLINEVIFGWTRRNFRKWTISTKTRCMCRMSLQFLRRHFVSLTIVMLFNPSGGHQDVMIFNFTHKDLQREKLLLCLRWIRKVLGNSIQRLFCRNAARCLVMKAEKKRIQFVWLLVVNVLVRLSKYYAEETFVIWFQRSYLGEKRIICLKGISLCESIAK